ncbi:hypothetical protein [Prochlorococcus sp. MIT 1300]|uniref:hypothetical protein n=1 Tax=Prochlorococcus sp. MIT 1300 TaxID=3096218 RepID=UPI002A755534|nr:hypothetical protein [Prochlorococcus sp. MIT 1300]
MGDSFSEPQQNGNQREASRELPRGGSRGGRGPGNREPGGFRIRLSDNEMRSARALQEAFNLRSTVAVLGFALRTLGQMLEEGKLNELVSQHRSQGSRGPNRREDGPQGARRNRFDSDRQSINKGPKPNPFARPAKPQPTEPKAETNEIDDSQSEIKNLDDQNQSTDSTIQQEKPTEEQSSSQTKED